MFINPIKENLAVAGNGVPSFVERVVTLVVAVRIGRLRSEGHAGDGGYHPGGENAGIRRSTQFIHDLLHGRDHLLRRQRRFLLHANNPVNQHIAPAVGFLRVHDRNVRLQCRSRRKRLARERTDNRFDLRIVLWQVRPDVTAHHREGQSGSSRLVSRGHIRVAMLFNRKRRRPSILDGVAKTVQRADSGIPSPGKNQPRSAPGADHLVVNHVRRHPYERELASALPDNLVTGRERDQMREPLEGDRRAVTNKLGNRITQGKQFSHSASILSERHGTQRAGM